MTYANIARERHDCDAEDDDEDDGDGYDDDRNEELLVLHKPRTVSFDERHP